MFFSDMANNPVSVSHFLVVHAVLTSFLDFSCPKMSFKRKIFANFAQIFKT